MINEIIKIFDTVLLEKCWISTYGRLAVAGKQKIGEKWKRFPLAMDAINPDCQDMSEFMKELVPDDTKNGIAFWQALAPIKYSKIPGISSARRLKKAEANIQFVCWLNIRKASGVTNSSNWNEALNSIIKEAIKTIDCQNPKTPTGINGISNLRIEVTSVGDIESWKAAMSGYSIENLDALTVWPFAAFTITCKLTFIAKSECFELFDCSSEFDATGFCAPDSDKSIIITRLATPGELDDYPHYLPLSLLPDDFWDTTDGVLRVTDSNGNEIPHSLVFIDIPNKKGVLFFKHRKLETSKKIQIRYSAGLSQHSPYSTFGSTNVWTSFDDVILHEVHDGLMMKNHKNDYRAGLPYLYTQSLPGIQGLFEMNSVEFGEGIFFGGIKQVNWRNEFLEFSTPKTFLFAFKCTQAPGSSGANLFSNYYSAIEGLYSFDITKTGSEYFLTFNVGTNGPNTTYKTNVGEFTDFAIDTWFFVAVRLQSGANGIEVDINGTSRALNYTTGIYPDQGPLETEAHTPRTGIAHLTDATQLYGTISAIWIYDGALTKAQRDIFYLNWTDPGSFWTL